MNEHEDQYVNFWKKRFGYTRPLPVPGRTYVPWEMIGDCDDIEQPMHRLLEKTIEECIDFYLAAIYKIGGKVT